MFLGSLFGIRTGTPMIFYHHTAKESLPAILDKGLMLGSINLFRDRIENGVWLTTSPEPKGHGLTYGEPVTEVHRQSLWNRCRGRFPADFTHWPDKSTARIKIMIPSSDRCLVRWLTWGKKRCDPHLFASLNEAEHMGGAYKTWWLYLGVIDPSRFLSVEVDRLAGNLHG